MASRILRLNIWSTRWAQYNAFIRSPWLPGLPEADSQSPPILLSNAVYKSTRGESARLIHPVVLLMSGDSGRGVTTVHGTPWP